MDLSFTEEEEMIREAVARLLEKACSFDEVKKLEESPAGYSPEFWRQMAELDLLGVTLPEEYGGAGLPFIFSAIIMEELGKAAAPTPFHSTVVLCGDLIATCGSDSQKQAILPAIAAGQLILTLAQLEAEGVYGEDGVQMKASQFGAGYQLSGEKFFVADANIADKLIVAARLPEGITLFLVDAADSGLDIAKMPTVSMDNLCHVVFHNVEAQLLGEAGMGWQALASINSKAAVAKSAEMVGGAGTALKMTVSYSKEREQYGKPIGGYQILQHYMANMLMAFDTSFNYLYKVVWKIDDGQPFATEAAALKAYVNESYKFITERSIQIHGGIGTTRECDIGLFYRRAKLSEYACGHSQHHYETVAQALGL